MILQNEEKWAVTTEDERYIVRGTTKTRSVVSIEGADKILLYASKAKANAAIRSWGYISTYNMEKRDKPHIRTRPEEYLKPTRVHITLEMQ